MYIAYSLFLRILLVLLKNIRLKCVLPDYRGFTFLSIMNLKGTQKISQISANYLEQPIFVAKYGDISPSITKFFNIFTI